MAKKKTARARIDEDLREDFDWALTETGMSEAQLLEASIKAFVAYVKEHGGIWLPLAIIPKPKGEKKSPQKKTPKTAAAPHGA